MASAAPHNPAPDRGDPLHVALHRQLLQRRKVLAEAIGQMPEFKIAQLLHEVDSALERFATGQYGICERCDETVEDERLLADPLTRVCLCELTKQQIALLETAAPDDAFAGRIGAAAAVAVNVLAFDSRDAISAALAPHAASAGIFDFLFGGDKPQRQEPQHRQQQPRQQAPQRRPPKPLQGAWKAPPPQGR